MAELVGVLHFFKVIRFVAKLKIKYSYTLLIYLKVSHFMSPCEAYNFKKLISIALHGLEIFMKM